MKHERWRRAEDLFHAALDCGSWRLEDRNFEEAAGLCIIRKEHLDVPRQLVIVAAGLVEIRLAGLRPVQVRRSLRDAALSSPGMW